MSNDKETPTATNSEEDDAFNFPIAVLLDNTRLRRTQKPNTIATTTTPTGNNGTMSNEKLLESFKSYIDAVLEPLTQRVASIEKAMLERTSFIAEQISTVSINQQTLHDNLLDITEKLDELQFEDDQSAYSYQTDESTPSINIPAKRTSNNADNESTCSTESSESLSNFELLTEDGTSINENSNDDDSVTAEFMNRFHLPEQTTLERHNQFLKIESRKYTSKFDIAQTTPPSTNHNNTVSTNHLINNRQVEQTIPAEHIIVQPASKASLPRNVPASTELPTPTTIPTPTAESIAAESKAKPVPEAAASMFTSTSILVPETQPQGVVSSKAKDDSFSYVYLNHRYRQTCKETRSKLCILGIPSNKILDIYFPGSKTVAVLFPDDYVQEAIDTLTELAIPILSDFDPLDPKNLGDPKYNDLTLQERTEIMRRFHSNQMHKVLMNMKEPVRLAAISDFEKKGWISKEVAEKLYATKTKSNNRNRNRNRSRNNNSSSSNNANNAKP